MAVMACVRIGGRGGDLQPTKAASRTASTCDRRRNGSVMAPKRQTADSPNNNDDNNTLNSYAPVDVRDFRIIIVSTFDQRFNARPWG